MSIQIHYSIHQNLLFTRFFSNYTIFCFTHRILSTSKNSSVQVINSSIHYIRILHTILPKLYFSLIQGFSTFVKPSNYNTIPCLFKFICIYSSHDSFQIIPFSIPVNIQESLNSQEKFQIIIFRHSISESISYILNPRNSPNRNTTSCLFKFISSPLRSSHLLDTQESTISAVQLESNNSWRDGLFHQQPSVSISSQGYNRSVVGAALVGQINTRKEWPPESDRYAGCKGSANWMQSRGRGTFRFRCLTPFIMRYSRGGRKTSSNCHSPPLPRFHFLRDAFRDCPLWSGFNFHFTWNADNRKSW